MAKLPTNPPTLRIDTTIAFSSGVRAPVENVLFALSSSMELIVAHPDDTPNDSVSKLPIFFFQNVKNKSK